MTNDELREYLIKRLNSDPAFCANVVVPALTNCIIPMEDIFADYKKAAEFNRKAMGVKKLEAADKKRIEDLKTKMEWEKTAHNVFTVNDIPDHLMEMIAKADERSKDYSFDQLMDDLFRWSKGKDDMIKLNGQYYFNRDGMIRVLDGIWGTYKFDRDVMWPLKLEIQRLGENN